MKEVTEDVRRQTSYVSSERSNLNLMSAGIKSGEIYGGSLINKAMASAGPSVAASGPLDTTGRRPLVVVRFDRQDVPYQQALYSAVSKVLERRPNALFDLVAVAPAAGGAALVPARRAGRVEFQQGTPPCRKRPALALRNGPAACTCRGVGEDAAGHQDQRGASLPALTPASVSDFKKPALFNWSAGFFCG